MGTAADVARAIKNAMLSYLVLPRTEAALRRHGKNLEAHLHGLQQEVNTLREQVDNPLRSSLIYNAFQVSGLWGDYVEFGVFRGGTMRQAYVAAKRICDSLTGGNWDFALSDTAGQKAAFTRSFQEMRFIGFDSFAGMPAIEGVDATLNVFPEGTYAASRTETEQAILQDIPAEQLILVEGFFDQTCTPETAARLALRPAVIHIDSDLYSSAVTALDFCTPYLRNGTVIIFDEFFQFHGDPRLGEQRAFAEWRARHPEWLVQELAREASGRIAFVVNPAAAPVG